MPSATEPNFVRLPTPTTLRAWGGSINKFHGVKLNTDQLRDVYFAVAANMSQEDRCYIVDQKGEASNLDTMHREAMAIVGMKKFYPMAYAAYVADVDAKMNDD